MEDFKTEYKLDIPPKVNKLKEEIVAFLNSEGGEIYLGINDKGEVDEKIIFQKRKEWEEIISNWIIDAFSPSVINLISIYANEIPFRIKILPGKQKPYFYKQGEGFNSKGVFIRVGSTKRVASFDEIKRMIQQSSEVSYETVTIEEKDLSFKYTENVFRQQRKRFDKKGLGLVDKEGNYNKAALFFSDQNPIITKFAVFQGTTVSIFLDKTEFSGSLIEQLEGVLKYANLLNKKKITISGKPQRDEYFDYPPKALREAIVNCFCHRDYSLSGEIRVEFYDDKVRIYSPGGLPDGLSLEDIKDGVPARRNKIIVDVLNKLNIIENYASGVKRIFEDYSDFTKEPEYYISNNGVTLTLYNRNYEIFNKDQKNLKYEPQTTDLNPKVEPQKDILNPNEPQNEPQTTTLNLKIEPQKDILNPNEPQNEPQTTTLNPKVEPLNFDLSFKNILLTNRQKEILNLVFNKKNITKEEMAISLKISESTIKREIIKLRELKILDYKGSSKTGEWIITK